MPGLIYLITGASRGIGRAYLAALLKRENNNDTIIAAVRNLEDKNSKSLSELGVAKGNQLIVVKIDSAKDGDPHKAVEELKSKHGISRLDVCTARCHINKVRQTDRAFPLQVVVANAGSALET